MQLLTTNYRLTKNSNFQTNFCFMPRALYQVLFSDFSNVIRYIPKFWNTYPTMMKLGADIPCPKKIQKTYESRDTPLEFC